MKDHDISRLLNIWQQHYDRDVEPQALAGAHLTEEQIMQMASPDGLKNGPEDNLNHLISCPGCFKLWAQCCRGEEMIQSMSEGPASEFFFGTNDEEEDVQGQSLDNVFPNSCRQFTITVSPLPDDHARQCLTLSTMESRFESHLIRVRDRQGNLIMAGMLEGKSLSVDLLADLAPDLSLWTVSVSNPSKEQ